MSTKNSRKVLSVLLAYMMVLSSFSGMAVAAEENTGENGAQAIVSSGPAPDADAADTVLTSTPDAKDVEDMIEALPDENDLAELDEEDWEAAEEAVNEAADAYNALDEDEQEKVDPELLEKLEALQEYFSNEPMLMAGDNVEVDAAEDLRNALNDLADGTVITLTGDIDLTEDNEDEDISISKEIIIDLNGNKLTVNHFNVQKNGNVTLKGESEDSELTSDANYTIEIFQGGTLIIESGTYSNEHSSAGYAIYNGGSLYVNGGTIKATKNYGTAVCNRFTTGTENDSSSRIYMKMTGGKIESNCWGVSLFGKGPENNPDHNSLIFDMSGGEIFVDGPYGGQGICTNATGGIYAGFTINLTDTAKVTVKDEEGCGMYLPGPGITNISDDVEISSVNQGIRIAAGTLNINGGTISNNDDHDETVDIVSGGNGGTAGTIVAGKAGSGYPSDIVINITGGTLENKANDSDAIVVTDKNMGSDGYEDTKIEVNVSGEETTINGNVYNLSTISDTNDNDGGNVLVKIENTTINGDIINNSKSNVTANNVTITGTVTTPTSGDVENAGTVTITDSKIQGEFDAETAQNINLINTVIGNDSDPTTTVKENSIINISTGEVYEDLAAAVKEAEEGQTIQLGEGTFDLNTAVLTIEVEGLTLKGAGEKTVIKQNTPDEQTVQAGILVTADDVTVENLAIEKTGNGDALKFAMSADNTLKSGMVKGVTSSSEKGHALNIHGVDNMKVEDFTATKVGKLSISISNSQNVVIKNVKTADSPWFADIGIMHENSVWYENASNVVLEGENEFVNEILFYSELTEEAENGKLDSITFGDSDKTLYKVLTEKQEDGKTVFQYVYVTEDKLEASIDDSDRTENPTGYLDVSDALKNAEDGETIALHNTVENLDISNAVKIDANGYKITGDVSLANGSSIENADLSEVGEITVESGSADLSGNYWGEDGPKEIDGATIGTYYEDLTALEERDPTYVGDQLDTAKELLEKAKFEAISSKEANTKEAVDELVREKLDEILKGFEGEYTIVDSGFTAAVDGDAKNPDGTEGEYTFSVVLTYVGDSATVKDLTIKITPAEYEKPEDPNEPEDPDNPKPEEPDDNDDDNHGSSGGSSGGGSFIGHPDGWVPGGIIILDGSEQIQPTGSLLLDTKTYTMAPGVVYDILATLEGASENELRVYSSQPGVASVEAIGGGKYRVTGLADGQTYIMFEVWRDGVMLNHASVKVTIADGVTAYGESNREASIF